MLQHSVADGSFQTFRQNNIYYQFCYLEQNYKFLKRKNYCNRILKFIFQLMGFQILNKSRLFNKSKSLSFLINNNQQSNQKSQINLKSPFLAISYKNSIQQNSTLQIMLIHVNHMYTGMGCILQDIQFMVGNVLNQMKTVTNQSNKNSHKNQVKQRISMPEKLEKLQRLEQVTFKMPKYQFLPSSSMKCENYDFFKRNSNEPEQVRGNNMNESISRRNDSFQQMFPQNCKGRFSENQNKSNTRPSSNPIPNQKKKEIPQQSQEDFMDYLFNKNKKDK